MLGLDETSRVRRSAVASAAAFGPVLFNGVDSTPAVDVSSQARISNITVKEGKFEDIRRPTGRFPQLVTKIGYVHAVFTPCSINTKQNS
jgi:hypothetical protein